MMKHYFHVWKNTLNELNDFSCRVEFLQCKIRQNICEAKTLDINEYMCSLQDSLRKHERNLLQIVMNKNNNLSGINDQSGFVEVNKINMKREFC